MVDPVVTPGVVLVGAGSWFAGKVFGPSAEALGDALRAYGTDRIQAIFGKAAKKVEGKSITPLPAGFAMNLIQKASFSEDTTTITEMWACLLAAAAQGFENRYASYVEILSQLTAFDAENLSKLVPEGFKYSPNMAAPVNLRTNLRRDIVSNLRNVSENRASAGDEFARLIQLKLEWPMQVTEIRIHYVDGGVNRPFEGGRPDTFHSLDNLKRLQLVEGFDVDNSIEPYETTVHGVFVTMLGVGLVQTCRDKSK